MPAAAAALALAASLAGCRAPDWAGMRRDDATAGMERLQAETRAILARHPGGLTLDACVAIAQERNTQLAARRLATAAARLDRDAAFGAFLPQVQVTYNALSLSEEPLRRFGSNVISFQDRDVRESSVQLVQPLIVPSAWLLYRSARRGAEIAGLAEARAGEMVALAAAAQFCRCAAAEEDCARLAADAAAARAELREAGALAGSGALTAADLAARRAAALAREQAADAARRSLPVERARLLQVLNLWPLAELRLQAGALADEGRARYRIATPGEEPREVGADGLAAIPPEEWLWHALLARAEMHIQDRTVALRRHETVRALAMFIPNLAGFASFYTTTDSYTVNQAYWATGLRASLASFLGFRDVAAYLKARREAQAALVEREDTAMMVLVQALEALRNLQDARAQLEVAAAADEAAAQGLAAARARERGGLLLPAELLQAEAAARQAVARRHVAAFAHALAVQAFRTAVGGGIERIDGGAPGAGPSGTPPPGQPSNGARP